MMIDLNLPEVRDEIVRRHFVPTEADKVVPGIQLYRVVSEPAPTSQERNGFDYFMGHRSGPGPGPLYAGSAYGGGAHLARWILEHPEEVRGKTVLDLASGSGITAIASAMAGAAKVTAVDIDNRAATLMAFNAQLNGVSLHIVTANAAFSQEIPFEGSDIITASDFYYRDAYGRDALIRRLMSQADAGKTLLLASWHEQPPFPPGLGETLVSSYTGEEQPKFFHKIPPPAVTAG